MLASLLLSTALALTQIIDLPGFQLSKQATPPNVHTQWTYRAYDEIFFSQERFGQYRTDSAILLPYFLTPERYFVGEENYTEEVEIPADWAGKQVTLYLERVHIVSHVWVNGTEAKSLYAAPEVGWGCRSLGAPHRYDLSGLLKPGETNHLRILINNTLQQVPVGINSYSVSDNDQGNWNGYIGKAQLIAQPATRLLYDATAIYPHISDHTASLQLKIGRKETETKPEKLKLLVRTEAGSIQTPVLLERDSQEVKLNLTGLTRLWDEHTPHLYHLEILLKDKKGRLLDQQTLAFGMREVTCDDHFVKVNGKRCYLRGTVDGAQFPLTGYPAMDKAFWTEYFQKLKPWGINIVRFHSWCPPEAAFEVADSIGMYMQVECSAWPNHDVSLSMGNPTAQYITQESEQILQAYGNHPSLLLLAGGNEPVGRDWVDFANHWVKTCAKRDPRHLYYSFAMGGSWAWTYSNQVHVRAGYRGLDWDRKRPESMSDFNAAIDTMTTPFIGHEVGQWATYPALKDIPKYTGFMRPAHAIICRDMLQQNGLGQYADSFLLASGRLQVIAYKFEMERLRRTRHYGGYGLQALHDYTGQGTANEGILNIFGEPKGYVSPEEWLQWAGEVVPLMRTAKFVYSQRDTLHFSLELSNMGSHALVKVPGSCTLTDKTGRILWQQTYPARDYEWGGGQTIAQETIALASLPLKDACQLRLEFRVGDYHNDWNIWVYPDRPDLDEGDIYVTNTPDDKALETLLNGGKVLILGSDQIEMGRNIKQNLLPEFWNHLWIARYSSHTHGLLIQNRHPLFRHFPTDYHSDIQWWDLVNRSYPIWMQEFPNVRPLVQSIDNAYHNRLLGMLFEVRVGKGRLMVTNMDLDSRLNNRIAARQMRSAILQYMKSEEFQPAEQVDFSQIRNLFTQ